MKLAVKNPNNATVGRKMSNTVKLWIGVGIIFLIAGLCVLLQAGNTASVMLSASFGEVSEGKNPDGSPFDINEILSDEVLQSAISKLECDMTAEDLRAHLTVSDYTDATSIAKVKDNVIDGNEGYTDFPAAYSLKYATVSEQIKSEGVLSVIGSFFKQFAMPSKNAILEAVSTSYTEYYNDRYIVTSDVLNIDWSEADKLDYYNKSVYVKDVIGKVSRFVHVKYREDVNYVSDATNVSYGDLYARLQTISDVDVENFDSYVIQNGLTNDRVSLLGQFNYMKLKNQDIQWRKTDEYNISKRAIEIYDPNVTKVVFIPSLDTEKNFYMNRTKVGMDYLVESANSAKLASDEAEHNVVRYDYLMSTFSQETVAPGEAYGGADTLYESVKSKIDEVVSLAKSAVDESVADNFETINAGEVESGFNLVSMVISGGKLFVMLLLIAFVLFNLCGAIADKLNRRA